jgi:hypothetical protein
VRKAIRLPRATRRFVPPQAAGTLGSDSPELAADDRSRHAERPNIPSKRRRGVPRSTSLTPTHCQRNSISNPPIELPAPGGELTPALPAAPVKPEPLPPAAPTDTKVTHVFSIRS